MEPPKLRLYQLTKLLAAKIAPHIYYALRYLSVIFDEYILYRSPIFLGADCAGTAYSCYGTKNKQENVQNNVIEGYIIRENTVDIYQKYQEKFESAVNMICQMK